MWPPLKNEKKQYKASLEKVSPILEAVNDAKARIWASKPIKVKWRLQSIYQTLIQAPELYLVFQQE